MEDKSYPAGKLTSGGHLAPSRRLDWLGGGGGYVSISNAAARRRGWEGGGRIYIEKIENRCADRNGGGMREGSCALKNVGGGGWDREKEVNATLTRKGEKGVA